MSSSPAVAEPPAGKEKPSITLTRRLNASPARVFAAWADAEKIVHWFGPAQVVPGSVVPDMDVRPGGGFRIGFHTEDGEYHQVGGTYTTVKPGEMLAFTWAWHSTPERESFVTVSLKPDGDGTLLTLRHERFFDEAARDGHTRGWSGSLDKLEKLFV